MNCHRVVDGGMNYSSSRLLCDTGALFNVVRGYNASELETAEASSRSGSRMDEPAGYHAEAFISSARTGPAHYNALLRKHQRARVVAVVRPCARLMGFYWKNRGMTLTSDQTWPSRPKSRPLCGAKTRAGGGCQVTRVAAFTVANRQVR